MATNRTRGKHVYLALSGALLEAKPDPSKFMIHARYELLAEQHRTDCTAIANALAEDNRAFDRERFLHDCGAK